MRAHRNVQHALCKELRQAGAEVDLERVVPEMSGRARQNTRADPTAIMDLYVTVPGRPERFLIDVTVRSPHAARYEDAARRCGQAAASGAKEKRDLYGPEVMPLPFESYGRLGEAGYETLSSLASAVAGLRWADHSRLTLSWRAACERALSRATADVALLALGSAAAAQVLDTI